MKIALNELDRIVEDERFVVETADGFYRIQKGYDEFADSPRDFDGNIGSMLCWHSRYSLGDTHEFKCPDDLLNTMMLENFSFEALDEMLKSGKYGVRMEMQDGKPTLMSGRDAGRTYTEETIRLGWPQEDFVEVLSIGQKVKLLNELPDMLFMPLYLLDHSGLSISTSDFADPWDSGRVGFIYTTRARYEEETTDQDNPYWKTQAKEILKAEVSEYDIYLQGFCYYVSIDKWCGPEDVDPEDFLTAEPYWKDYESCGGFLGADDAENGVLDFIEETIG